MNPDAFREDEPRTFTIEDISLIKREPAEKYIKRASAGKFIYGSEVEVEIPQGKYVVKFDSYFDGFVSGISLDGERITGGANFFKPYK